MQCHGRTRTLQRCRSQARLQVCHQHRFQPWLFLLSILTFIGLIAGLYQDALKPLFQQDNQIAVVRQRLIGQLESALSITRDTVTALTIRLDTEQFALERQKAGDAITLLTAPQLPDTLEVLVNDGESYALLSESIKDRLPYFIEVPKTYLKGYETSIQRGEVQLGGINMMLEEYRTQQECIELELRFQCRELDQDEHESLFIRALRDQVIRVKGEDEDHGDLADTVRLGEPSMMNIPYPK